MAPTQFNRAPAGQPAPTLAFLAGQLAPNLAFLPAQPGPNPLPSSALQELFQQGGAQEEHTAGPTACSLLLQGLASWGVFQASSLYPHT